MGPGVRQREEEARRGMGSGQRLKRRAAERWRPRLGSAFPTFEPLRAETGQPPLDLFDPFGFSKNRTPEQKERGLLVEINNGRAAMLGIMGFVSAASIDGSVPALDGKIAHYAGNVMAPFSAADTSLPFVAEMLKYPSFPLTSFW